MYLTNGDKYDGEWKYDKRDGLGICYQNKTEYEGEWRNGKIIKIIKRDAKHKNRKNDKLLSTTLS